MMNKKQKIQLGVTILLIIAAIFYLTEPKEVQEFTPIEGRWDISSEIDLEGYNNYLVETTDFDYSHPVIQNLAKQIKESSSDPEDSIKKTIKYVAKNVKYSGAISISYCYSETASQVAQVQEGDCVSMSRLVTALLRAQGIPTRTVGGCLTSNRCDILFATIPYLDVPEQDMSEGDFKKRGFLHEWVEAWTPDKGWITIEATAGRIYPTDCNAYLFYGYDTNNRNRCVITDMGFWNQCKVS